MAKTMNTQFLHIAFYGEFQPVLFEITSVKDIKKLGLKDLEKKAIELFNRKAKDKSCTSMGWSDNIKAIEIMNKKDHIPSWNYSSLPSYF